MPDPELLPVVSFQADGEGRVVIAGQEYRVVPIIEPGATDPHMTDEEILAALDDIALRPVCDFTPFELGFVGNVLYERAKSAGENGAPTLEDWKHGILRNIAAARPAIAAEREAGKTVWSHRHPEGAPKMSAPPTEIS